MKTEIKFTRRYTTDVNYEYEEYTSTLMVEDNSVQDGYAKLKADVEAAHAGESATGSEDDAGTDSEEESEERKPGKTGKKSKGKPTTTQDEESEDEEEEAESEDSGDDSENEEEDDDASGEDEEDEEKKPSKKTPSKSGGKGFKKKPQVYQRSNETHKDIFGTVLKKIAPNWKKSFESKAHAKKVSVKLEGKEFLDEDGKVLASFEAEVKKAMGKFK